MDLTGFPEQARPRLAGIATAQQAAGETHLDVYVEVEQFLFGEQAKSRLSAKELRANAAIAAELKDNLKAEGEAAIEQLLQELPNPRVMTLSPTSDDVYRPPSEQDAAKCAQAIEQYQAEQAIIRESKLLDAVYGNPYQSE